MKLPGGRARGGWGTAVALLAAVVLLSVLDALPLVLFPLAALLLAFPRPRRWRSLLAGVSAGVVAVILSGGALSELSQGWGIILGGAFALTTLWWPSWGVSSRALVAVSAALGVAVLVLAVSDGWEGLDWRLMDHFRSVSTLAFGDLRAVMPDSEWAAELGAATQRIARLQSMLFPAVLALQSLAALGLASWWVARLRPSSGERFALRPLREFRFNDQLVWLLIGGLLLVVLPLGDGMMRVGFNALVFMGGLYALRGVAVFLFLAGRAPTVLSILFGAFVALFLYPLVLMAALLVGLGDTWLDVRGRVALAPRT